MLPPSSMRWRESLTRRIEFVCTVSQNFYFTNDVKLSVANNPTYGPVIRSPYNPIAGWTHPLTKIIVFLRNDDIPTERTITLTGNDLLKNEIVVPHYFLTDREILTPDINVYISAVYISTNGTHETSSDVSDIFNI